MFDREERSSFGRMEECRALRAKTRSRLHLLFAEAAAAAPLSLSTLSWSRRSEAWFPFVAAAGRSAAMPVPARPLPGARGRSHVDPGLASVGRRSSPLKQATEKDERRPDSRPTGAASPSHTRSAHAHTERFVTSAARSDPGRPSCPGIRRPLRGPRAGPSRCRAPAASRPPVASRPPTAPSPPRSTSRPSNRACSTSRH